MVCSDAEVDSNSPTQHLQKSPPEDSIQSRDLFRAIDLTFWTSPRTGDGVENRPVRGFAPFALSASRWSPAMNLGWTASAFSMHIVAPLNTRRNV